MFVYVRTKNEHFNAISTVMQKPLCDTFYLLKQREGDLQWKMHICVPHSVRYTHSLWLSLDYSVDVISCLLTIFHTSFVAKFMIILITEFCILTSSGWLSRRKSVAIYALLFYILKGKITKTKLHIIWRC